MYLTREKERREREEKREREGKREGGGFFFFNFDGQILPNKRSMDIAFIFCHTN